MPSGNVVEANAVNAMMDAKRRRLISLCFALATVAFICATIFFYVRIPHSMYLMVVPEVLFALAFMPPLFMWQTLADRKMALKIAGISSCLMWVLSLIASFIVKTDSVLIYVPDALLLAGFLPLLYTWRFSAPWIVFGVLNIGIGFFLQLVGLINNSYFPRELWAPKLHIMTYHPGITWMVMGFVCCVFGVVRLIKNLTLMLKRRHAAANRPAPMPAD